MQREASRQYKKEIETGKEKRGRDGGKVNNKNLEDEGEEEDTAHHHQLNYN